MTTTPERKRSIREITAAECYERYKASFLHMTGAGPGMALPDWEHLDPAVKNRWVEAVAPLAEATLEIEWSRNARRQAEEHLERYKAELKALRQAVSAARAALPDMIAFAPLHGRFPKLVADLQKAVDAADAGLSVRKEGE